MTDVNETTGVIMKTDRRGRLRYTAQQKQAFLEAFESSGLSGPQFASLHGVHYQTLVSWLRKRRQARGDNHPALQSLVPAVIDGTPPREPTAAPLEIQLPCGLRLMCHGPTQLDMLTTLIRKLHPSLPC